MNAITVMGNSNMDVAISDLARSYARDNGVIVNTSFAPPSTQEAQITDEGAGDVLITSDEAWIDALKTKGLVDINSITPFAKDQLALIGPNDSTINMAPSKFPVVEIIKSLGYEPGFAVGNPETLAEGRYSKEALRHLGVAAELEPYTVYIKEREQMFDLVAHHQGYGIFFYSTALNRPDIRVISILPENSHHPIEYFAVVIASNNMDEARKFLDYLKSVPAKNILRIRGFLSN